MDEEKALGRIEQAHRQQRSDSTIRSLRIKAATKDLQKHRGVLERLQARHNWGKSRQGSFRQFLWSRLNPKRPPCPPNKQLQSLAEVFFPPRALLNFSICDFGAGHFERHDTNIGRLVPVSPAP